MDTLESQKIFEVDRIDPGFARGKPPHGFEPICDRFFGAIHDCAGGQGVLMFTARANVKIL